MAKVAVDIALDRTFDYRIPSDMAGSVHVGSRVQVPFGRAKKAGYVLGVTGHSDVKNLKSISHVMSGEPLITPAVMEIARWMSAYYCAPVETAIRTVLPGAVRRKGAAFKKQKYVFPTEKASDAEAVSPLRTRAPKQAAILDLLLSAGEMSLQDILKAVEANASSVQALEKKGFLRVHDRTLPRRPHGEAEIIRTDPLHMMDQQAEALALIKQSCETRHPPVVLLYGVTGSGKTEVYLQAIDYVLKKGQGAIVLVPEISLTPQTVERFLSRFGEGIAVLHSHLSDGERHDEWHRIHQGKARIVIGARSALFAPVRNPGLIVVDEEHETTYKQEEAPRYHARDVAVMRGRLEGCPVVLGSATPSIESYYNVQRGKYGIARMPHRVDHRNMPFIRIVDMRAETEKAGRAHIFSRDLIEAVKVRLERAEQTILFLNRRGYSTSLVCPRCGYVVECPHCSVPMTYHKSHQRMHCHICGNVANVPERCPNSECRDPAIKYTGLGTERIEEIVGKLFPKARVARMDSDTMTRKDAYSKALGDFRTGRTDILVGTQMIAKGLHFPNVTLVGVVFADISLHMPDFRAGERTFQLITQVAGRAGRGDVHGEVLVQTYTPYHPAIQGARRMDYEGFCDQDIAFREELGYPPFRHLTCITLRSKKEELVMLTARELRRRMAERLPSTCTISDAAPAPLARARGQFRYQIMMRSAQIMKTMPVLRELTRDFKCPKEVSFSVDVDAHSLL